MNRLISDSYFDASDDIMLRFPWGSFFCHSLNVTLSSFFNMSAFQHGMIKESSTVSSRMS